MIFQAISRESARAALQRMERVPKWDTSGGMAGIDEIIGAGHAFIALDQGVALAVIVVDQVAHEYGRELLVSVALQIDSNGNLAESLLPEIERVFAPGCDAMTIVTKRAGLVRQLVRLGYAENAKIMRKKLK